MGKRSGKGGGKSDGAETGKAGRTGKAGKVAAGDGATAVEGPRGGRGPGLLDRLTWLVLVAFLVLLAVAHG